jgi:uncharacterized protein
MTRLIHWRNLEGWRGWATAWRAESVRIDLGERRFGATGVQLGVEPYPYRLDYLLETDPDWITRRLLLMCHDGMQETRRDLRHDGAGNWTLDGEPRPDLDGALDCDLGYSPLTNTMPVLRERIREGEGPADFTMAWVDVPTLTLHASRQRYEPIDAKRVRYVAVGDDFDADLELDDEGFVVRYPHLAQRVDAGTLRGT